jgi:predicted phosphate transport protein (TIGR00153 family)
MAAFKKNNPLSSLTGEKPLMQRSLDLIFHAMLPKDKKFYPLFDQAAVNMVEIAKALESALKADSVTRLQSHERIDYLEKQGDEITHAIMREASSTFIVPFDREDIQALAMAIDDVVDYICGASKRLDLYKIHQISPAMIRLAELIVLSTKELQDAITEMRNLRNVPSVRMHIEKIGQLENEADTIMNDTVGAMFRNETDAMYILKMKEVISFLETATDKCEDASNVIESVIVKFS